VKKLVTAATLLATAGAGGAVLADGKQCFVAMSDWQPRPAVQAMAEARGWTVRRIKTDDGCYEIKGRNAKGREIEAKVDPSDLSIVDIEYEDGDDEDEEDLLEYSNGQDESSELPEDQ